MSHESVADVAARLARNACRQVLADETHARRAAQAAVQLQKARRTIVQKQESLLHALGFATQSDYQALSRQASRLKRRAHYLRDALEKLAADRLIQK